MHAKAGEILAVHRALNVVEQEARLDQALARRLLLPAALAGQVHQARRRLVRLICTRRDPEIPAWSGFVFSFWFLVFGFWFLVFSFCFGFRRRGEEC